MSAGATDLVARLHRAGVSRVIDDPAATEGYRRDQCLLTPAGRPAAVVRASSVDDVVAVLRTAGETGTPVVTRGAGTGLAGAANAIEDGIVLDVSPLDRIVDIDPVARTATVQPGVRNGDLDREAGSHGLRYAPDPGSRATSTIGGNIATNAGGLCCAKYGVTADHVLTLTTVLADGEIIHTGRTTRKDVAGLDLTRLLIGSEGTLGVIVEATVALLPTSPVTTAAATFPTVADAVETVLTLGREAITPCTIELMDRATVRAVNAFTRMGLDEAAGAVLLLQCDGASATDEIERCAAVAEKHGATEVFHTSDEAEGTALMEARRVALTALEQLGTVLLDDVGVPVSALPRMQARIEATAARHEVTIGCFGHAGDGNLHPTIVYDAADPDATLRARAAFDEIVDAALDLGGTISGEHGIGQLKATYLRRQVGTAEIALMRRIKHAFDPRGILNPGRGY